MRITEAARRLEMTPRMLRYRESLGLLPALRHGRRRGTARGTAGQAGTGPVSGTGPGSGTGAGSGTGRSAAPGSTAGGSAAPGRTAGGSAAPGRTAAGSTATRRIAGGGAGPGAHRQFSDADVAAVALGLSIERRYDISPVALAFGVRVLADPRVRAEVAELGRRIGRIQPPPARALDFEQERAQRLLRLGQGPG